MIMIVAMHANRVSIGMLFEKRYDFWLASIEVPRDESNCSVKIMFFHFYEQSEIA